MWTASALVFSRNWPTPCGSRRHSPAAQPGRQFVRTRARKNDRIRNDAEPPGIVVAGQSSDVVGIEADD